MKTSKRMLNARYNPIEPLWRRGNRWCFASETTDAEYLAERDDKDGTVYRCGCPSTGLCKHIIKMVLDDARPKWAVVQVWTSEYDVERQHRRTLDMTANGRPFWVTYAGRKRTDEMAALDKEINALGLELARQRRLWYSVGGGQVKADARLAIERLGDQIAKKQRERAAVAGRQMREAA